MLLRKNTKRHILRVVCMIMLMLIHFDAYGYELAAVFQEVNAEHVLPVSEAEIQIVQGNGIYIRIEELWIFRRLNETLNERGKIYNVYSVEDFNILCFLNSRGKNRFNVFTVYFTAR